MATESVAATPTAPSDVGLKREMGLIGATWASETSIIGSGWLFGALFAAQAAGPIALLGWVIGGIAVIFLALVHAELGGMYPVSGGTARFPHLAYGSVAGISFGFFSWVQAITVAPIECFAVMQYGSYYWHGLFDATANGGKGNVTGLGFAMTVVLLVIFTALNFLAMKHLQQGQLGHHLVEGGHPGHHHHHLAVQVPRRQLQQPRLQLLRLEGPVRGHPVRGHRVRLSGLRAGRPTGRRDQEPAEEPAPGHPAGHLHRHHHLLHAAGGVHRRDAEQPDRPRVGEDQRPEHPRRAVRRPGRRSSASPRWPLSCGSTRSSPRSAPA